MRKIVATVLAIIIAVSIAEAHPGRTDSMGGHNGSGGYHYHNESKGSTPKQQAPKAELDKVHKDIVLQDEAKAFLEYYEEKSFADIRAGFEYYQVHYYEYIKDGTTLRIGMRFFDAQASKEVGLETGKEAVEIMLDWLKHKDISTSGAQLFCYVKDLKDKECWYVNMGKDGNILSKKP